MKWISDQAVGRLQAAVDDPDLSGTRYRIVRRIAQGGMGTVYLADDLDLSRQVALKVMISADSSADLTSRMLREARVVARLEHPGIVPVHDVGTLADGRVFYTMKFVQGQRLDEYASGSNLSDRLRIFERICEAVAFAHAHGVLHRDLKPENILVGKFGEVQVMDWGVAKVFEAAGEIQTGDETRATLPPSGPMPAHPGTEAGTVIGTPAYMSPEQALGATDTIDERTDIYALGVILYFLLTGKLPYDASSVAQIRKLHGTPPPSPRSVSASIAKQLDAICMKAISIDATHRYASADEIASDVSRFLENAPVTAYKENVWERFSRWIGKNQFLVWLILAYLVLRVVVLLLR